MAREIGIAGNICAETAQPHFIPRRGDVGKMHFAATQFRKFFHGHLCGGVDGSTDAKRNKGFLHIEARRFTVQQILFKSANGLNYVDAEQVHFGRKFGQHLERIEQHGGSGQGLDTLITGEAPHQSYHEAMEMGLNLILAGHYATETFGVKAVAGKLAEEFDVSWVFLHFPTGL